MTDTSKEIDTEMIDIARRESELRRKGRDTTDTEETNRNTSNNISRNINRIISRITSRIINQTISRTTREKVTREERITDEERSSDRKRPEEHILDLKNDDSSI